MYSPAGYLVNRPDGVLGDHGIGYDYIMAANGLYVQSKSDTLVARALVADCRVRGLAPVGEKVELPKGLIPAALFERGLSLLMDDPHNEGFFAISWDGSEYRLRIPKQYGTATSVVYDPLPEAVAEFHSHGTSRAFFSRTDDMDEQGFRIYGVLCRMDARPQLNLRLGIYGHFTALGWSDVFDGPEPVEMASGTGSAQGPNEGGDDVHTG